MNFLLLSLSLPLDVVNAVATLQRHGVDEKKLYALVMRPKRGRPRKQKRPSGKRGAPNLAPITMPSLDEAVQIYREDGATSDREAIRQFVRGYVQECRAGRMRAFLASLPSRDQQPMTEERLVKKLQQGLSRFRRTLHKS